METATCGPQEVFRLELADDWIEVWPGQGFNCLRWDSRGNSLLDVAEDWSQNPVPTRNGHPVLFPFPNRLQHGRFSFQGREYQLPLTDRSGLHAIHGFTPRVPWRVIGHEAGASSASITGEFRLSLDVPDLVACWPADARLRLTYRLLPGALRVEAEIDAADQRPMPFGLGYHPYFKLLAPLEACELRTAAGCVCELSGGFPTGRVTHRAPLTPFHEFEAIGTREYDMLLGDLATTQPMAEFRGGEWRLAVTGDSAFQFLMLFTPAHRRSIAIEPYTCLPDAANLSAANAESGWRILAASETCTSIVEYSIHIR